MYYLGCCVACACDITEPSSIGDIGLRYITLVIVARQTHQNFIQFAINNNLLTTVMRVTTDLQKVNINT